MNLTISVDQQTIARARKASEAMGKSLNQVLREYLEELAGRRDPEDLVRELRRLRDRAQARSGGWKWNRNELYDGP
ncbi:MAG: DUF6364 family protein [Candidatus Eremiobacterota bacterium]